MHATPALLGGPPPDNPLLNDGAELRRTVVAAVLLLAATLVCFHRLTLHPSDILVGPHDAGRTDVTTAFGAMRQIQAEAIQQGRLPTWNARLLCGLPFVGNPQSGSFYPVNWLYFLWPSLTAIGWVMVAHHWFAGVGTYLLARRYELRFWPSLLAGVAFLAGPFLVAATAEGHYTQTTLVVWTPWALLAYERVRSGQLGGIPLTALAIGMSFFCGHAQETFYLVLIMSALAATDSLVAWRRDPTDDPWRLAKAWGFVLAAVVGLVMVDLLPIWIYTKQAVRAGGIDAVQASSISLGATNLWQLLDPSALGGPGDYRGEGNYYWETLCYFGTAVSLLAAVALATSWRRYPVVRLAVIAVVTLLFAFGDDTPLFPLLHRYLPGISFFRSPSRALYFTTFAMAILAGVGLDWFLATAAAWPSRARRIGVALCGLGAVGVALLAPWRPELSGVGPLNLMIPAVFVGATLLLVAATLWQPRWSSGLAAAVVLVALVECSFHSHFVTATVPPSTFRSDHPVRDFLAEHLENGRVLSEQLVLSDREAIDHGFSKMGGLEGVPLARSAIPMVMLSTADQPVAQLMGFDRKDLAAHPRTLLDLVGIRYAAVTMLESPPAEFEGWQLVQRGTMPAEFALRGREVQQLPYAIYAVADPMPRAFVLGTTRKLDARTAVEVQIKQLNPRHEVLVEQDVLPRGPRQPLRAAEILEDRDHRVRIKAELTAPGYLVLSDTYYPGWTARVDGEAQPIVPVNVGFRGVALEPGQHEVVFEFWPPGFTIGAAVSLLTLFWMGQLTWKRRREKSQQAQRTVMAHSPESVEAEAESSLA